MVTIGNIVEEEAVANTWNVSKALILNKPSKITTNRSTTPIRMNINVVTYIDFRQKSTTDIVQKKVINYVSN